MMIADADTLLFDLDGTIINSRPGVFASVRYALSGFELTADDDTLMAFLGPPLVDSFMTQFGFSEEMAKQATARYREYYIPNGIFDCTVYPGIREALETLKNAGKHLLVATSKPEIYARQIMDHFALTSYFEEIAGAATDGTRDFKEDVLRYLLEKMPDAEKKHILMVGDRKYDIEGAAKFQISCVGVAYGYAPPGELVQSGAEAVCETPQELVQMILKGSDR